MKKAFFLPAMLLLLLVASPGFAFDDDSRDDTRSLVEIRTLCANGRQVTDSPDVKMSCAGDTVYVNRRNTGLFKNEVRLNHQPIRDFKVARDGRVYYRTEIGPYLYDENGPLGSNQGTVLLYLLSSLGDVVYLNSEGEIFKNGRELDRGAGRVPLVLSKVQIEGQTVALAKNPVVSTNGRAIYQNDTGFLYVDGDRQNIKVRHIRLLLVNSTGDVYYVDDGQRLFRNSEKLFDGRFTLLDVQLSPRGQVAYLTDQTANNLFFEDRVLGAGAHRVVSFNFNSAGEVIYQDSLGRLWEDGHQLTR